MRTEEEIRDYIAELDEYSKVLEKQSQAFVNKDVFAIELQRLASQTEALQWALQREEPLA